VAVEYSLTEFDQTGFFHSAIEMADDEQGAGGRQRHVLNIPAAPGMVPELLVIMQMFQQQRPDDMQQRAQEMQQRRTDLAAREARFQQQRADNLQ
jgi:hypothetical protein